MATVALRRFTNPDTLRHIGDRYLIELLAPHAAFFCKRGLALPAGTEDAPLDHGLLAEIFMSPDTDMPRDLAEALFLIHEMSTKEAMDKLRDAADEAGVDLELNGDAEPADVAVRAWLKKRTLIEEVHAEHELSRPKAFVSYLTDRRKRPPFTPPDEATREAMEQAMDAWFEKKNRGSGCRVLVYPREGECWFMVRHGEPCRREGAHGQQGQASSVFYRPQQHDVLIYNIAAGEMRIHAGSKGERELYKRTFGLYVFGDENFFPGEGKYTLAPLAKDGPAALECADVDGIEWVKLRELEFLWSGSGRGNAEREIRKANDLFAAFASREFQLKESHDLKRAVFQIKFRDAKRPRSVTIAPSNRAKYERDDDSTFLEHWFQKRGFILSNHDEADTILGDA